ncbi:2-oxoglutarate dehydrogenase, E2 component, dihydrolipoamide succinyltransferase [Actinomycetota bacterium]
MSEKVTMPALGESVTEGTVTRWLKSVGDSVEVDEPLLEVSTDKVDTEIPSPVAGTLEQILAEEDETVEVGADLAVIGDGSGGGESAAEEKPAEDEAPAEEAAAEEAPTEETAEEPAQEQPEQEAAEAASDQVSGGDAEQAEEKPASGGGEVSGGQTVTMPALGESVTEGTVTRWLKAEGDDVEVDEPLLEVSTDKVDTEIPSPVAGTLTKILVQEDETVEVGADLAIVGGEASGGGEAAEAKEEAPEETAESTPAEAKEEAPEETADGEQDADDAGSSPAEQQEDASGAEANATEEAATPEEAPAEEDKSAEQAPPAPAEESTTKETAPKPSTAPAPRSSEGDADASAYVTPLVRKLASDHGVDLASITGTGVGGRIRKQDVLEAAKAAKEAEDAKAAPAQESAPEAPAAAPQAAPAASADAAKRGTTEKMSRMRKVIAQRMTESLQTSAQLTATVEVDMSKVAALRARNKKDFEAREGAKLTFLPFIALATVEALKAYPKINSSLDGESIVFHGAEHLGVAVDTERGLMVPVIRDAGDLSIAGLAKKIADLGERTRGQKVTPDELGGGTFTITNYGSAGTLFDTPIINQPQVAILGTGTIVKRPVVITDDAGNDLIAIRSMMYLSLTYDHRVVDGADAGRFLAAIKARLEEGKFEGAL